MENQRISTLLKLIANPERRAILFLLLDSEHSVPELAEAVGLSATSISNHLAKLRTEGVVDFTRYHRVIEYRLTSDATATLLRTLRQLHNTPAAACGGTICYNRAVRNFRAAPSLPFADGFSHETRFRRPARPTESP